MHLRDCSPRSPRPGATRRWPTSGRRCAACAASSRARLEIERAAKQIGSGLEAAPQVYIADAATCIAALDGVDLAEVCITSGIEVIAGAPPAGAFALRTWRRRRGAEAGARARKCARSWRITRDVGSDPAFPELSARDAAAVREFDARASGRLTAAIHWTARTVPDITGAGDMRPASGSNGAQWQPCRNESRGCGGRCRRWGWAGGRSSRHRRSGPQGVDARRLPHRGEGPGHRDAVSRSRVRQEHRRQLRPVRPGEPAWASGCWRALRRSPCSRWPSGSPAASTQAGRGQPRPDHGRGRQQRRRPPGARRALPTSSPCTPSASTGTCSISPTSPSLPGSSASSMIRSVRVAMMPQRRL